jgi:deoxyribonuclease V
MKTVQPARAYDLGEARRLQASIEAKVRTLPLKGPPARIAGLDAAYSRGRIFAAACLYEYPALKLLDIAIAGMKCGFPYVPGFLSFREGPALMEAMKKLGCKPDLILVDGQGIAHPRGLGIASHLGVLLDVPSIGCAKSRLVGVHREPGAGKGERTPLVLKGRTVGAVLRTREGVRPVYVSPGHRIDIEGAVEIVLACTPRYRIPEPLRCADSAAGAAREKFRGRGRGRDRA